MKTIVFQALFFLSLLFLSENSIAEFIDGNALSSYCSSKAYFNFNSYCYGYISGAFDTWMDNMNANYPNFRNCFSKNYPDFKLNQLVLTVKKYIRNNPQYLNLTGSELVSLTIVKYYSSDKCSKERKFNINSEQEKALKEIIDEKLEKLN